MTGSELYSLLEISPHNAHKAVFDEYCRYVYTIVFNRLRTYGSREDIEECVSDIFADIYLSFENKSEYHGDLKGYIGSIAKRRAIDAYRSISVKYGRTVSIDSAPDSIDNGFDLEEKAEKNELRQLLINAVNELGKPDSDIIIQKFYYNMSSREIANNLSMKASAVRMRCGRAINRLRQKFSDLEITF